MIVLCQNAAVAGVPFDFDHVMGEPGESLFMVAFEQLVDLTVRSRQQSNHP